MRDIVNGVLRQDQNILMAHRASDRANYPGTWSFPGGHVEAGESLEEALVRELTEEIGVVATSWRQLERFRFAIDDVTFHVFVVDEWQGEPVNMGREHSDLRWVNLAAAPAMPKLTFPIYVDIFSDLATS